MQNLRVAQAICDSLGINADGDALAKMLTMAVRADTLGHGDRYKNTCEDIGSYLKQAMVGAAKEGGKL